MTMIKEKTDYKKVFWQKGACSHALFHILNREFGYIKEKEEEASNPLAGGILQKGHQCGMLWGSTLAVGAEAYRRCKDCDQAIGLAITATQDLMKSFVNRTKSANCREITTTDFSSKLQMLKYLLFKAKSCFDLAEQWAPEAIQAAKNGLSKTQEDYPQPPASCASLLAKKKGASEEEMVMVAGFAGGIGLSGNACGALGAAIWMNSLELRKQANKSLGYSETNNNPKIQNTLKQFYEYTEGKMFCQEICGQTFHSINDHTEFVKQGGCEKIIDVLAAS